MSPDALERMLREVAAGNLPVDRALERLAHFPGETIDDATVDHQRTARCGFPEVIYGLHKTPEMVLGIAERLVAAGSTLLATRLHEEAGEALAARFPDGTWHRRARVFHRPGSETLPPAAPIAVLCAGTSDLPVAEEAAVTAEAMGVPVRRIHDVGVAGLHRVLAHQPVLREVAALVVVAGMEGALPSVVGGLTDRPVIAVPTSVGYGASFGGLAALLGMLNSCASGVTVVNIDNGFSAGHSAALIARQAVAAGGER